MVARGRDNNIGAGEEDVTDLGTRRKWESAHSDDGAIQRGRLVLTSDSWPGSWAESLNSMVRDVCVFPQSCKISLATNGKRPKSRSTMARPQLVDRQDVTKPRLGTRVSAVVDVLDLSWYLSLNKRAAQIADPKRLL